MADKIDHVNECCETIIRVGMDDWHASWCPTRKGEKVLKG